MEVFLFLFILAFVDVFLFTREWIRKKKKREIFKENRWTKGRKKIFWGVKHVKKPWNELLLLR